MLEAVECVEENGCRECLSGMTSDERRQMFRLVKGC